MSFQHSTILMEKGQNHHSQLDFKSPNQSKVKMAPGQSHPEPASLPRVTDLHFPRPLYPKLLCAHVMFLEKPLLK